MSRSKPRTLRAAAELPVRVSAGLPCRGCGCTNAKACRMDDGTTCSWILPDVCSACVEESHPIQLTQIIFGHKAAVDALAHMARGLRELCLSGQGPAPWPTIVGELSAQLMALRKRACPEEIAAADMGQLKEIFS